VDISAKIGAVAARSKKSRKTYAPLQTKKKKKKSGISDRAMPAILEIL
jgi:hypothetical protein